MIHSYIYGQLAYKGDNHNETNLINIIRSFNVPTYTYEDGEYKYYEFDLTHKFGGADVIDSLVLASIYMNRRTRFNIYYDIVLRGYLKDYLTVDIENEFLPYIKDVMNDIPADKLMNYNIKVFSKETYIEYIVHKVFVNGQDGLLRVDKIVKNIDLNYN